MSVLRSPGAPELYSVPLTRLLSEVRKCSLCTDLPLGPRPLLQCTSTARILIAGQAPGRRAHERGIPFDDPSGERLRDWLGIDRNTFYDAKRIAILPLGFCYPGTGKSGDLPPRAECAPQWRSNILAHMPNIRLTVLIGLHAQRWHLPDCKPTLSENVRKWQATWPECIPLPHPSPRNKAWLKRNPVVELELLPALRKRVGELLVSH
jgi:uracil-DNA glycosylase